MASSDKVRRGGRYCVAGAPNNQSCTNSSNTPGIRMHQFPADPVVRDKWVKFVRKHRHDFDPQSMYASLCSAHFEESCYSRNLSVLSGMEEGTKIRAVLIRGAVPTRDTIVPAVPGVLSERSKRQLKRDALASSESISQKRRKTTFCSPECEAPSTPANIMPSTDTCDTTQINLESPDKLVESCTPLTTADNMSFVDTSNSAQINLESPDELIELSTPSTSRETLRIPVTDPLSYYSTSDDTTTPLSKPSTTPLTSRKLSVANNQACKGCIHRKRCHNLQRVNKRLKGTVAEMKKTIKELHSRLAAVETETEEEGEGEEQGEDEEQDRPEEQRGKQNTGIVSSEKQQYYTWSSTGTDTETEDEGPINEDRDWAAMEEGTSGETTEEEEGTEEHKSKNIEVNPDTPGYDEPKFIVFYRMLLKIFALFCFTCKADNPHVSMQQNGTMVTVTQHCSKCTKGYVWRSQPFVHGKCPAGNVLLSFAVLMAGASISKILLVFRHMGLSVFSSRTFFSHQRSFVFPTVIQYWESYRAQLINTLKNMKEVVWSGDGRFDSMGHCAKYGAYTMFCSTIMKVVHFELIQSNETGGSQQMELEGAKRCFQFLERLGLTIPVFISDRHRSIAKWIREVCVNTTHYYDIWHVARSVTKKLLQASKEKGCEIIKDWMRGIRRHLYWSATSTTPGFGSLILAKWNSFMRHVSNKHSNHPDPLYKECHHNNLEPRKWIKVGTAAYDKLSSILTAKLLLGDIKKLSPDAQTSCLEGFHATLNHWHPKMIGFSWLGSFCRHILASLHFNENIHRETKLSKDGEKYYAVTYPKFKLGEEVVREVASPPTYGYVDSLKRLLFTLSKSEMKEVFDRYSAKAPQPLNTEFTDRLGKNAAVKAYEERIEKQKTSLFPPSAEQESLHQNIRVPDEAVASNSGTGRRTRNCQICKKPRRGHPRERCQGP